MLGFLQGVEQVCGTHRCAVRGFLQKSDQSVAGGTIHRRCRQRFICSASRFSSLPSLPSSRPHSHGGTGNWSQHIFGGRTPCMQPWSNKKPNTYIGIRKPSLSSLFSERFWATSFRITCCAQVRAEDFTAVELQSPCNPARSHNKAFPALTVHHNKAQSSNRQLLRASSSATLTISPQNAAVLREKAAVGHKRRSH